jgi:ATP-dependent helicase/nuclease subunit B
VNVFGSEGPRWFSIPAHRPFVEDLATGLLRALGAEPETLADAVVLTPTRRGARALAEAFVKANGGKAVLLPQIRALGDLDEGEPPFEPGDVALDLPPAISPGRRRFELARLVAENQDRIGRSLDAAGALEMADALGGFLDSCQIEEIDALARLPKLVEGEMARHFEQSADVLKIALEEWPKRLADLGLIDVSERRVALLRGLAAKWRETPPAHPLIAAGSTGTAPATADLLAVIAAAPMGAVVLPGLDEGLAEDAWAQVGEQHPQGAMKRLLERADVDRSQVQPWLPDADTRGRWRRRVINEALRPAEATKDWREVIGRLHDENPDALAQGLDGLTVTAARGEEEAASVCALLLREALETPGKTAALVTPDRALARRVSARLARWGIAADSSAGAPLAGFPVGVLLGLVAKAAADPLDPVTLLAILKHPLSRLGEDAPRRRLEYKGLRGPRPRNWEKLFERLAGEPDAQALAAELQAALAPMSAPFDPTAEATQAAEALARTVEALAGQRAWAGAEGESAAQLLAGLIADAQGLPPVTAAQFAELVATVLSAETVRTGGATHPRLRILGAIEARLVRADRLILAGLEDGVWPPAAPVDPFLSRPMREKLGLPPPERRLGLTAHDFAQAACAPEVFLIHAERRDNAPAVESRWLWRLKTLAKGAGVELPRRPELLDWARALDAPIEPAPAALRTAPRPRPTPPLEVRPRKLPVTGVERWVRDPYAVYARYILRLRPLERPDEPIEARARGTAVHAAFERFAAEHPELPEDAETRFAEILVECLVEAGMDEPRMARERALAANVAPWVLAFERRRRAGARLIVEQQGELTLTTGAGDFTVTAKADRIELREAAADILDFKTGAPPKKKEVAAGFAPQLTLTAAILQAGGFTEAGAMPVGDLVYVQVSGGRNQQDEEPLCAAVESPALAEAALEGLRRRIERFDDPATPYLSWAAPKFIHQFEGDYDHLARLWEWHVIGEGEAEA